jgi:SAM-dependent methyltransferase
MGKRGVIALAAKGSVIDPVVAYLVAATNGLMYKHLIGRLDRYPIPDLPLPDGRGRRLVDVGCSWGRWSVAASRRGYEAVGVDPSLGAVIAARRVARQLGATSRYVVADARYLPFADETVDVAFSYSVLQHFSQPDAELAVSEMGRLLRNGGMAKVQLPTQFGIRCLYHQARRGFRSPRAFEVRYRTLGQLAELFESRVGPPRFEVDGYFGIGLQRADEPLMRPVQRAVLRASEALKQASRLFGPLVWVADSVFVEATRLRA